jgi:hypothetical protein
MCNRKVKYNSEQVLFQDLTYIVVGMKFDSFLELESVVNIKVLQFCPCIYIYKFNFFLLDGNNPNRIIH